MKRNKKKEGERKIEEECKEEKLKKNAKIEGKKYTKKSPLSY